MGEYLFWAVVIIIGLWIYSWTLAWLRYQIFGHQGWEIGDLFFLLPWLFLETILLILNIITLFTIAELVYGELKKYRG